MNYIYYSMESNEDIFQNFEEVLSQQDYFGGEMPNKEDIDNYMSLNSLSLLPKYTNINKWYSYIDTFYLEICDNLSLSSEYKNSILQSIKLNTASNKYFGSLFTNNGKEIQKYKNGGNKAEVVLFVKVFDYDTDLHSLAAKIFLIEQEGLLWKSKYKIEPIAISFNKLVIWFNIDLEKTSVDEIVERIEDELSDYVQSVDVAQFTIV